MHGRRNAQTKNSSDEKMRDENKQIRKNVRQKSARRKNLQTKNCGRKIVDEKMSDEKMPDEKRSRNRFTCCDFAVPFCVFKTGWYVVYAVVHVWHCSVVEVFYYREWRWK